MSPIKIFLITIMLIGMSPGKLVASEGTFVKYMISAQGDSYRQKALSVGHQSEFSILETKTEAGFWIDNTGRPGATSSAFLSGSIGVEPKSGAFYVNFFQGVGLITHPDQVLGGPAQFFEDIGLGIRDQKTKVSIGLFYKHVSSAGIFKPNKGRDFLGIQVMLPW